MGVPVGNFDTHMRAWCKRTFGTDHVPDVYHHIAKTLTVLGTATAVLAPVNGTVQFTITTPVGERLRASVYGGTEKPEWFDIGVRMGCNFAVNNR